MTINERLIVLIPVYLTIILLWGSWNMRPIDAVYSNDYKEMTDSITGVVPEVVTYDTTGDSLCPANVKDYLDFIGVHHSDIVLRQSILETGWFKSHTCRTKNNLFGLTNSKTNPSTYFAFDNWKESCIGYRDMVQYKYEKMGYNLEGDEEEYYHWLVSVHYASDPLYIQKLRGIRYEEAKK